MGGGLWKQAYLWFVHLYYLLSRDVMADCSFEGPAQGVQAGSKQQAPYSFALYPQQFLQSCPCAWGHLLSLGMSLSWCCCDTPDLMAAVVMATQVLHEETNGEAIITTGVGQHQMWAAQWYKFRGPRQWATSGGLGSMGFGLPSALGAAAAFDGKDGRPKKVGPALVNQPILVTFFLLDHAREMLQTAVMMGAPDVLLCTSTSAVCPNGFCR